MHAMNKVNTQESLTLGLLNREQDCCKISTGVGGVGGVFKLKI